MYSPGIGQLLYPPRRALRQAQPLRWARVSQISSTYGAGLPLCSCAKVGCVIVNCVTVNCVTITSSGSVRHPRAVVKSRCPGSQSPGCKGLKLPAAKQSSAACEGRGPTEPSNPVHPSIRLRSSAWSAGSAGPIREPEAAPGHGEQGGRLTQHGGPRPSGCLVGKPLSYPSVSCAETGDGPALLRPGQDLSGISTAGILASSLAQLSSPNSV